MKKYTVYVRVQRDFKRVVIAKTESQAIKAAKESISKGVPKIRMKDFEKQCDNAIEVYDI